MNKGTSIMPTKDLIITNREKIREKWEKSPSEVRECIKIVKEWLKTQKHLPEIANDNMIEFILTNCKYSIERAKHSLDMYYTLRVLLPEFFKNCHPTKSFTHKIVVEKMGYYVPLPKLLNSFHRVTIVKFKEGGEDVFDNYKYLANGINTYEIRLHEDLTLGEIFVFDLEFMTRSHALKYNPAYLKKVALLLEEIYNNRVLEIHFINYPPFVDLVLGVAKLFLKKKLYERIFLHKELKSLFNHVPQEVLPREYGGKEKSLDELAELWELKFKEYEDRFDFLENLTINEELRSEPLTNSEVLGYYGNFKKIDVD